MTPVETEDKANIILIPAVGPRTFWHSDQELELEKAYEIAGFPPGGMQIVVLRIDGHFLQMLIHEKGKLRDLPINGPATELFWEHYRDNGCGEVNDFIVGPALILIGEARWA